MTSELAFDFSNSKTSRQVLKKVCNLLHAALFLQTFRLANAVGVKLINSCSLGSRIAKRKVIVGKNSAYSIYGLENCLNLKAVNVSSVF